MHQTITHVLVLVDPKDVSLATQIAAIRLAAGTGALVTLLHVNERGARIKATAQLDALENLHQILWALPHETIVSPVHSDDLRRQSIKLLNAMRDRLMEFVPDGLDVRVVYRSGDAAEETTQFIEDAGVDVVFIESPASSKNPEIRRLANKLQRCCPCQLQTVCSPNRRSETLWRMASKIGQKLWPKWRTSDRRLSPAAEI